MKKIRCNKCKQDISDWYYRIIIEQKSLGTLILAKPPKKLHLCDKCCNEFLSWLEKTNEKL